MSISKQTLHPEGDNSVDIYPKTSVDQVEGLEANPIEEGTENLEKLRIGDTVYTIPQGGGGGGEKPRFRHNISIIWYHESYASRYIAEFIIESYNIL